MKGSLVLSTLALSACAGACVPASALSAREASVVRIAERARTGGARACAPEELALADAHLRFFALETRAGDDDRAAEHLTLAELNARAALLLASQGCTRDAPATRAGVFAHGPEITAATAGASDASRNLKQVHASSTSATTLGPQRDPSVVDVRGGLVPPRPAFDI